MVYSTTKNMNEFGTLLEKLDTPHMYCMDNVLHITAKNDHLDSWYNGAFSGVTNDAEDINMDEVVERSTMEKVRSLVEYFSWSNQELDNL